MPPQHAPTYLFPDSLHRDLCLAVVHEGYTARLFFDPHRTREVRTTDAVRWLSQGLGPCAFYGAYGGPSREIVSRICTLSGWAKALSEATSTVRFGSGALPSGVVSTPQG